MSPRANILVTRPAGQAGDLVNALCDLGYTPFEQPLLELHPFQGSTESNDDVLANLHRYQHLIFISGNAVRFGMDKILERGQLPQSIKIYAIGRKTAMLLRQYGLEAACAGDGDSPMTSEALLALAQLGPIDGQKVLIVKGVGGRNTLRKGLVRRGATVDQLICYERHCPQLPPGELAEMIASWEIDLLLISSGEGFGNMLKLLSPQETINLYRMPLIVPSARVAGIVREAGFTAVHEAKNATDHAMLEAVQQLQCQVGEN